MARLTRLDRLGSEIEKILGEYNDEVLQDVFNSTKQVVRSASKAIRSESKAKFGGKGKYVSGWTSQLTTGRISSQGVIYNLLAGLPHLLEYGHANRAFGRSHPDKEFVDGKAHVSLVQDMIDREFTQVLERKIRT